MRFDRRSLLTGVRDVLPLLLGVAPFGLITGVSAVAVGISASDVTLMSMSVFAGASQLAAIALVGGGAGVWVVWLTTLMINLRHLMYAAALAPMLQHESRASRAAIGAVLVDHTYAFGSLRLREDESLQRRDYLLGVGGTMWLVWSIATAAGAFLGAQVPSGWQLDFAVPLMFLALLVPTVRDRASLVAAVVGGGLALALAPLPYNLGLVVAAVSGIAAGTAAGDLLRTRAAPT